MIKFKIKKFYITTAIPYVNGAPHIGHALEFIQTDVLARFYRLKGRDVFFLTGTDENAQKNVLAAEKNEIPVQKFIDNNVGEFKKAIKILNISNNDFIRTTDKKRHWPGAIKLWNKCNKSGDIYKKRYTGLYCVGCEAFVTEKDLKDGLCPEHLTVPEKVSEENYFFRLSRYQKKLENLIKSNKLKIIPETRKNEVLSFIKSGLEDFSVSRPFERMKGWGITVPSDKNQIMYVWYDALTNYISALGYGGNNKLFKKYWPADLHVIGKGIVRFHAVYWPAMLLSAGLQLPKSIFVHGYVTIGGQKMSKSLGNIVNPINLVEKYGTDLVRFFMLNEISPFEDGNFSENVLIEKVNNELVANLGNFIHRTLSFSYNFLNAKVKRREYNSKDLKLTNEINDLIREYEKNLEAVELREGSRIVLKISDVGNKYFQDEQPWVLVKKNKKRAETVIFLCLKICQVLATLIEPYLPGSAEKLRKQLGIKTELLNQWQKLNEFNIKKPAILFKKIDEKRLEELKQKFSGQGGKNMVEITDFEKLELKTGVISKTEKIEGADKLLKLEVDTGEKRTIVAGIAKEYRPEELIGKEVIVLTNLKPVVIKGIKSDGMLLAAVDKDKTVLLVPDKKISKGSKVC